MADIETEMASRYLVLPGYLGENEEFSTALFRKTREVAWAFDSVGYPKSETVEVSPLYN
jgi:hypothetical protein